MIEHHADATEMPQVLSGKMFWQSIAVGPAGLVCLCYRNIGHLKLLFALCSSFLVLVNNGSYFGAVDSCRCTRNCWFGSGGRDCELPLEASSLDELLSLAWYPVFSVVLT